MIAPKPMTVSGLTNSIKLRLEEHYPSVFVVGEVTNFTHAASGHMYFTLKDANATLKCAFFRGFNLRLRFDPRNGMSVIAQGGVTAYTQRGEFQLIVQELKQVGVGDAELALRELKEKLSLAGYFLTERKRKITKYPRRVGLIASPTGAAIRDMLEILSKRWPAAEAIVRSCRVQGPEAPEEIAASIELFSELHRSRKMRFDAVVLGRGGGSSEDLAAFNAEMVADAVYHAAMPIVSAIGHETDYSIADMVADVRALTPSEAIVALCPDRRELMDDLAFMTDRLNDGMTNRLTSQRQQLARLADRPVLRKPWDQLRLAEQKLDVLAERITQAMQTKLNRARDEVEAMTGQLEALSPLNILKRGYALAKIGLGPELLRSVSKVTPGEDITIQMHDGHIVTTVQKVQMMEPRS